MQVAHKLHRAAWYVLGQAEVQMNTEQQERDWVGICDVNCLQRNAQNIETSKRLERLGVSHMTKINLVCVTHTGTHLEVKAYF